MQISKAFAIKRVGRQKEKKNFNYNYSFSLMHKLKVVIHKIPQHFISRIFENYVT